MVQPKCQFLLLMRLICKDCLHIIHVIWEGGMTQVFHHRIGGGMKKLLQNMGVGCFSSQMDRCFFGQTLPSLLMRMVGLNHP